MTRVDFDALVRAVETRYQGRQAALERDILRWMALGLALVLSWVLVVTSLGVLLFAFGTIAPPPAGLVMIGLGVLFALFGVSQLRYLLHVEHSSAEGRLVAPGELPALDSMLSAVRGDLRCRPFHEVRISLDFNASIRETPRLGLLGWSRASLEIGLILARAMSPDELKAILAHECVHISERHGRSTARIYRHSQTWNKLTQSMQKPAVDSFSRFTRSAFSRFLGWYWPRLQARTLVLSRAHEYQADREAARVAGKQAMATALWRLEGLTAALNDRFWPDLFATAADLPEPPLNIVDQITRALQTPPKPEDAARWTDRGLSRATLHDNTHPALVDRVKPLDLSADALRAMGFLPAAQPSAAEFLLGDALPAVEAELSEKWRRDILGSWRDRYRRAASDARRKARAAEPTILLDEAAPDVVTTLSAPSADVPALWDAARNAANLKGLAHAVPFFRDVLAHDPDHDGASVLLGRHLALNGDPEGETLLNRVLDRNDQGWVAHACEALKEVYRADGRLDLLRAIDARLDQHESDVRDSHLERSTVTASDAFLPHSLPDRHLAPLLALLASIPDLGSAWLVQKKLRYFPARPLYVLCIRASDGRRWSSNADQESALLRRLVPKLELPGQTLAIARQGPFRPLARAVMALPHSPVYRRDQPSPRNP